MYIQCTCKLSRLYYTITKYYYPKTFTGIVENQQKTSEDLFVPNFSKERSNFDRRIRMDIQYLKHTEGKIFKLSRWQSSPCIISIAVFTE